MQSYVFRMGDNPNNLKNKFITTTGYPVYFEEEERAKEIIKNIPDKESIGNPSTNPPKGFDTWEEYWIFIKRPERY